ncbi:NADPH-dependent FMN reductase [Levilactobacillus suantsaii]|uniref:NAD(P)H-dependent oxidoreductase n=1 Tax=Levilactobacillus suantsaii TaxID=2292255 RepID=A0A4Q0VME1_9LACO|nr:NADPH-dependent FMN reductase [Levilactobacillus suantsaii]QMU07171.1 NAD(P)H-dependent oxidoreductase [Levilactobacillus suantsaii]RXI80056.1 NAD(P)H-dependent oxidoreductase [Levilactobacillus suantsaii]
MKLVGIVGTNAVKSTNRQLLQYMQRHFASTAELEICEIADLPAFNEPEQRDAPAAVQQLADQIEHADGVIFATPEYDHSIPAVLKSAIEWLSYTTRPLINKPVMVVGASYGSLGTSRAQAHLRQILEAPELKALVMPNVEYMLGHSLQAFDEQGDLVDQAKAQELDKDFQAFTEFVTLMQKITPQNKFFEETRQFSWSQLTAGKE